MMTPISKFDSVHIIILRNERSIRFWIEFLYINCYISIFEKYIYVSVVTFINHPSLNRGVCEK